MSPRARWSLAAAVILLTALGALLHGDRLELTQTTFGNAPPGFGALYELLGELELSAGRSHVRAEALPVDATVWWIAPNGLCDDVEDDALESGRSGVWRSLDWLRKGGTGVLWLPEQGLPCLASAALAGLGMPTRAIDVAEPAKGLEDGDEQADQEAEGPPLHVLSGPVTRAERNFGETPLRFFDSASGWDVLASARDGAPFALARRLGGGRLVLLADTAPLRNRWLDHEDAAPFALDIAMALGAARFDEREHGILPTPNPLLYLAGSTALPVFVGALTAALLLIWYGRALPQRTLSPAEAEPPTLAAFVDSLSTLYAGTRDHDRVLERYREFTVSQLRRVLRLQPDAPFREVRDRLVISRGVAPERLAPLTEPEPCAGRQSLEEHVARLDALVREVAA